MEFNGRIEPETPTKEWSAGYLKTDSTITIIKKAKFLFEELRTNPETICETYPYELLTGRGTSSQWHTQTRTAKSKILRNMYPQSIYVEINPVDATDLNIAPDQMVWVSTRRGKIKARTVFRPTVRRGQIFIPMHYVDTNILTLKSFDPYSRQPSYKSCAAQVTRVNEEGAV